MVHGNEVDASPVRIAVLHDSPLVVEGLTVMLAPYAHRVTVVPPEGPDPTMAGPRIDVALAELSLELPSVAVDLAYLKEVTQAERIVVYGRKFMPGLLESAVAAGASGYLSMTLPAGEIVDALEEVHAGATFVTRHRDDVAPAQFLDDVWFAKAEGLSRREAEVVVLIAQGLSNPDVAARAHLSKNTVKTYIRSAYHKMGVTGRSGAVLWAVDHGFVKQDW